jgi:hypothetical protein
MIAGHDIDTGGLAGSGSGSFIQRYRVVTHTQATFRPRDEANPD